MKEADLRKANELAHLHAELSRAFASLGSYEKSGVEVKVGPYSFNGPVGGYSHIQYQTVKNFVELALAPTTRYLRDLGVELD